jgi:hypothetical protein
LPPARWAVGVQHTELQNTSQALVMIRKNYLCRLVEPQIATELNILQFANTEHTALAMRALTSRWALAWAVLSACTAGLAAAACAQGDGPRCACSGLGGTWTAPPAAVRPLCRFAEQFQGGACAFTPRRATGGGLDHHPVAWGPAREAWGGGPGVERAIPGPAHRRRAVRPWGAPPHAAPASGSRVRPANARGRAARPAAPL